MYIAQVIPGFACPKHLTDHRNRYAQRKKMAAEVMSQVMECQRLRETGPLLHPSEDPGTKIYE